VSVLESNKIKQRLKDDARREEVALHEGNGKMEEDAG
jgi:hypothetical protein